MSSRDMCSEDANVKKSKIGFYANYKWEFNLTHEIVHFLELIATDFYGIPSSLPSFFVERAKYLLEWIDKESEVNEID